MVHVNHHHHPAHEVRQLGGDDGVKTDVSVVFVTAPKTFAGPILGYSTPSMPRPSALPNNNNNNAPNFANGGSAVQSAPMAAQTNQPAASAPASIPAPASSQAPAAAAPVAVSPSQQIPSSAAVVSSVQSQPPVVASSSVATSQQTTLAQSVSAPTSYSSNTASLAGAQSAPSAAPPAPEQQESSGMSSGGKAGLAIGLIAIFAILAAVGFWFYRRKQEQDRASLVDNEKSVPPAGGMARSTSMRAPAAATVQSRAPNGTVPVMNEKQGASAGITPVAAPTTRGRTPEPEKPATNPFADPTDAALAPKPLVIATDKSRPVSPVSPITTSSNEKSATAVAPARGADGQPLNVHRVQLDFAPSMDDELGLKQGQLVRLLHEYDDGWCLCVRLDRSQQGVCPRSCVSKTPLKPKPGQGPNGAKKQSPTGEQPRPGTAGSQTSQGRARKSSNAVPAPLNVSRPTTPQQGPFGEGEYKAQKSPVPSFQGSQLSNSPNQSPPSSPETKHAKPATGS